MADSYPEQQVQQKDMFEFMYHSHCKQPKIRSASDSLDMGMIFGGISQPFANSSNDLDPSSNSVCI